MPFTVAGRNTLLGALPSPIYVSLHSANPGETGTNEITGGTPAYARKAQTLNAASAGSRADNGVDQVFDVPAGATVAYTGYWTASSGGTFLGYDLIDNGDGVTPAPETYGAQGTYTLTALNFSTT